MCSAPAIAIETNQTTMIGPNSAATLAVPRLCAANSAIRMMTVSGSDKFAEGRAGELEPFNRREHRNRRRDDRIAEKHRGADDADDEDESGAPAERARRQRRQRQRAALAVIVGAQQDQNVFQRDRDDQRPHDQRQHAEHDIARHRLIVACGDRRFAEGVKRAGADVAVDDANAAERQRHRSSAALHCPCLRLVLRPAAAVSFTPSISIAC